MAARRKRNSSNSFFKVSTSSLIWVFCSVKNWTISSNFLSSPSLFSLNSFSSRISFLWVNSISPASISSILPFRYKSKSWFTSLYLFSFSTNWVSKFLIWKSNLLIFSLITNSWVKHSFSMALNLLVFFWLSWVSPSDILPTERYLPLDRHWMRSSILYYCIYADRLRVPQSLLIILYKRFISKFLRTCSASRSYCLCLKAV